MKDQANQNSDSKRLFVTDSTGNELRPDKLLNDSWVEKALVDSTGYYDSPLEFYLEEGEHRLTLETVREPIAIKSIKLCTVEQPDSYEAYLEKHASASDYSGSDKIYIQAEYPTATSDRTIYQLNDRSSVITMPQDPALIKMNEIGGEKWQYAGQWIEYTVTVPESGFYIIVPRSKQDVYAGMYTSRKVYINGEVPRSPRRRISASIIRATGRPTRFLRPTERRSISSISRKAKIPSALKRCSAIWPRFRARWKIR